MENIEIKVTKTNISLTNGYILNQGEYQVDKCKFTFSNEYVGLVKKAIFVDGSTSIDMVILNDECNIPYEILQNSNEFTLKVYGYQVQNEELVVRYSPTALKVFLREGSYVGSNEVITPSQFEQYEQALHDGLDDLSEAMETMETTVNAKLGEMNEALEDVETATTEANNLNLDVSKSGKVATVTLTKKDASTKVVTLSDGTSLMFQWDGTKLGIKTDEEESYTYVDLQGVQGETGLTPNIQIGTVASGSTPSVTRTGTNENPILNFTLVKGDKGDTGNTGETGATGNGIVSIEKTATSGLVDTYTITYTNGTTTTFNVTNGEDGEVTQTQLDETNKRVDLNSKLRNALPKVTGTGTEITLNDTAEAEMVLSLSGNTIQETEPTPTNPQDIVNVTGDNSVKVQNKNLFNSNNWYNEYHELNSTSMLKETINGIEYYKFRGYGLNTYHFMQNKFKENTQYTIKFLAKKINTTSTGLVIRYTDNSTSSYIYITDNEEREYKLTSVSNKTIESIGIAYSDSNYALIRNIMLYEGTIDEEFVPYQEQTYPITLGNIEMASSNDNRDCFEYDKVNDKWYFVEYMANKIFDGTETWGYSGSNVAFYTDILTDIKLDGNFLTSHFKKISTTTSFANMKHGETKFASATSTRIFFKNTDYTSTTNFKEWLSTNNVEIEYELATPISTQVTDTTLISQLEAIRLAYAYQDQTNITQENDGAPFNIDAEAVRDMTSIFDLITTNTTQGTEL